ncbi:MAG: four helix bundle protein [Candidatus Gracilibacteria bacterium]|nr:four helix bundle protein [Candidatus Gracilibacteria bacterium]MDQ7022090.1 four helix bundle protein [Candidatus Gracilibacteria bacterium]
MARFTHLPIYKKSFGLLVMIEELVLSMERKSRYTIGSDLRNIFRSFITNISRVNGLENKYRKAYIEKMFDEINQVYILLSVMKELKLFTKSNQYEIILEEIFNIEKQLEGWKKSMK